MSPVRPRTSARAPTIRPEDRLDPPTEHKRADHTPADHTPADHTPADHTPADHTPADHTPADHRPAEQKLAEREPPAQPGAVGHPPRRAPRPREPWSPTNEAGDPVVAMGTALEHALGISTAATEDELITRMVEAAGRLTAATVACTVPGAGPASTWGDGPLAHRLVTALAAGELGAPDTPRAPDQLAGGPDKTRAHTQSQPYDPAAPQRVEFPHLGLPDGLYALVDGAPLVVASAHPDRFGPPAQRLLGLVVAHAEAGRARLRELALLARKADSDPLTGIRHYRPFEERLAASIPGRTAVIAIDVDNFKQINDSHGHQAGDAALVALVGALSRALRGDDHIYRIGGDEFAVVIEVATAAEVTAISRRLLRAARRTGYPISIGAALRSPHETGRETLRRADRALYQAKLAGRNTIRLAA